MILEAKNIDYSYKTMKEKKVLNQVSMQFEEGRFYTIIGTSGAGKTTFLSLLAGLDVPTCGEILYNGENILKSGLNYHRKNNVSLVFQNYNLIDYLTTEENVKLGGEKNPRELLSKVNLPQEAWTRNVLQLSGGQQQRDAIARALAKNPKLLLCDEPTGALDYNTGKAVLKLLQATCRDMGKTVIVITHNQALTAMADRIITVKSGTVVSMKRNENIVDVENIEW